MRRNVVRMAAMALLLLVAACDKCGNVNITVPSLGGAKVCTDIKPNG